MSAVLERGRPVAGHYLTREQALERIRELEEELWYARELLTPAKVMPAKLGLTRQESKVLGCLLAAAPRTMTMESLYAAMYGHGEPTAEIKIVTVVVCKTNKKLARFDARIMRTWGVGYYLPAESAVILRAMGAAA